MKKLVITALLIVVLSGCNFLNGLGLYTTEQYNAQVTQVADQGLQIQNLGKENEGLQEEIKKLTGDKAGLEGEANILRGQITELKNANGKTNGDLARYQAMICEGITWKELLNIRVWELSQGNPELQKVERDTQVKFYLTQMLSIEDPINPEPNTHYVLVIDFYSKIALNARDSCLILDNTQWKIYASH